MKEQAQAVQNSEEPRRMETYREFCEWYAMPYKQKKEYGATSQREFAAKHDISEPTLSRWKDRPEFYSLIEDERKKHAQDRFDEVMEGLIMGAKKGFAQNVELYLAYFFGWTPKQVHEHREKVDLELGDIRKLIQRLPEGEQEEFYGSIAKLLHKAKRESERPPADYETDGSPGEPQAPGSLERPTD